MHQTVCPTARLALLVAATLSLFCMKAWAAANRLDIKVLRFPDAATVEISENGVLSLMHAG